MTSEIQPYQPSRGGIDYPAELAQVLQYAGYREKKELDRAARAAAHAALLRSYLQQMQLDTSFALSERAQELSLQKARELSWVMANEDDPLVLAVYKASFIRWVQTADQIVGGGHG